MARIIIESGKLKGRKFTLPPKGAIGLGRDAKCAIRLTDGMVSRVHSVLRPRGGRWILEDRGSSNGTLVNGDRIDKKVLTGGDMIKIGETILTFTVEEDDPLIGKVLGGYRVELRLGRGAMGTVYRARQLSLDRTVALKLLAPELSQNREFVQQFLKEARAAGRLNHPNVVQVYDAGQEGDQYYISMEYLDGGTLEDLINKEQGSLEPARIVPMAIDAARALAFAERQSIVHRDIKPANLLLDSDGKIKVGDLGIAADMSYMDGEVEGKIVGSPRYMAPEQARGETVDHRADIYSLGATIYRALSGSPPFDGTSVRAILRAKIDTNPAPLRQVAPNVPLALATVVQRMMERDVNDRFDSAEDVEEALSRTMQRAPAAGRASRQRRSREAVRTVSPSRSGGSPLLIGAGMVIAVLVLGLVAFQFLGDDDDGAARGKTAANVSPKPAVSDPVSPERDISGRGNSGRGNSGRGNSGRGGEVKENKRQIARREALNREMRERDAEEKGQLHGIAKAHAEFSAGKLSASQARGRIEAILSQASTDEIKKEAELSLQAIRTHAEESGREDIVKLDAELKALIAAGDLEAASKRLERFVREHPDFETSLASSHDIVRPALEVKVKKEALELERLVLAGKIDEAKALLDALASVWPKAELSLLEPLRSQLEVAVARQLSEKRNRRQSQDDLYRHIASLDFAKGDSLAASISEGGAIESDMQEAVRDYSAASRTWRAIHSGLAEKLERMVSLQWKLEKKISKKYRVCRSLIIPKMDALRTPYVRVQTTGSKPTYSTFAILSLAVEDLLELTSSDAGLGATDARRGLALLLFLRRGADRSREALPDLTIAAVAAEASLAEEWRQGRSRTVNLIADNLIPSDAQNAADCWQFFAEDAAEVIVAWRQVKDEEGKASLVDAFKFFRGEALRQLPPGDLFHAESVSVDKGTVSLRYDGSSAEQAEDFNDVGDERSALQIIKGQLHLSGEVRFLEGTPFQGELSLQAKVVNFEREAPNVNIAFWTSEDDAITATLDVVELSRRFRGTNRKKPTGEASYFALCQGYKIKLDFESLPGGLGRWARFLKGSLPSYLDEPIFAIFAGAPGEALHERMSTELVWEMPAASKMRSAFKFSASSQGQTLKWSFGGRKLPFRGTEGLEEILFASAKEGSLTFFTNGRRVVFKEILIEGRLHPDWLEARIESQVLEELEALQPAPKASRSSKKKKKKKSKTRKSA